MSCSSLRRSDVAAVNEGSHSFTCQPHVLSTSGMSHSCLYSQPQSFTGLWLVVISFPIPAEGSGLSWPVYRCSGAGGRRLGRAGRCAAGLPELPVGAPGAREAAAATPRRGRLLVLDGRRSDGRRRQAVREDRRRNTSGQRRCLLRHAELRRVGQLQQRGRCFSTLGATHRHTHHKSSAVTEMGDRLWGLLWPFPWESWVPI